MDVTRFSRLRILAAAALFSTGGAAIKSTALGGWQVACLRSGVAAVTVLLLVPAARRGWSWRTGLVAAAYAATLILFVTANKLTTSANSIFLQSAAPLYVLILGPWLLKEKLKPRDIPFILAVMFGLSFFFIGREPARLTAPDPVTGNILACLSGVAWALTVMGLRALGRGQREGGVSAATAVAAGNILAFLFCLPWALPIVGAGLKDAAVIAYLGIVQIGLAYILITGAIPHVPALEATLLLLLEPALNPIWAWLVLSERPGPWALAGGVIILLTTAIKARADTR